MAKRRSIFDTITSDKAIKEVAKEVQQSTLDTLPQKNTTFLPSDSGTTEKQMQLYVGKKFHQQSKVNSSLRGMKLGAYIEWLIEQDSLQFLK